MAQTADNVSSCTDIRQLEGGSLFLARMAAAVSEFSAGIMHCFVTSTIRGVGSR